MYSSYCKYIYFFATFPSSGYNLNIGGIELKKTNAMRIMDSKRIKYFSVDFSHEESIHEFLSELNSYEKIDVLVNNAGINVIDNFIDTKNHDFDQDINHTQVKLTSFLSLISEEEQKNNTIYEIYKDKYY